MSNYDSVENFIDYANKDAWKSYVENYVIPVWRNASILKEFFENLKSKFQNFSLGDVSEKDLPLLLGGVVPGREDIYKKNSLAKFYDRFFGLKLSDLKPWLLGGEATGIQPKVIVEETAFIRFVDEVLKWSNKAVQCQALVEATEPKIDYDKLKENANELKELIKNFYQSVLNISVNYNYGTFFLWSIKQIPYRFMKEAYPRIDGILDFLQREFGLTRFKWKSPFPEGSKLYEDYTIWCWPEYNAELDRLGGGNVRGPEYSQCKSFGGSICALNEVIWKHLSKGYHSPTDLERIFTEYFNVFPDLKEEYVSRVKDRLTGKIYSHIYYGRIMAAEDISKVGETNLTIMQMIDEVSPYLFTGLAKITYVSDGHIIISQE